MITIMIVLPLVALLIGVASGFVIGTRQAPRMIARMNESELDTLADRVREYRHGTG